MQYKKRNVSDWMGEHENGVELNGFYFRGGQKPATQGIWIWSEIFTHNFDDGRKVAIILMDTQGIFDNQSTMKDCMSIFSISMLISSVHCYNIMQQIQENDLQNLHLFMEYGELALKMHVTGEKPFQSLLFIVRDWPFAYETNYGYSQEITNRLLDEKDGQADETRRLRKRIKSSFDNIKTFLLPHPGLASQQQNFKGNSQRIDINFKKYVKKLAPSILAPENLIVKRMNGQEVQVRDLLMYFQNYINEFNGKDLPTPESLVMVCC